MKLTEIEAGGVYTYTPSRDHSEYVRVISTDPHAYDRTTDGYVPAPGARIGGRNGWGCRVGVLIAGPIGAGSRPDLSDPKWDDLTADAARQADDLLLTVAFPRELHPREQMDVRIRQRQAWREQEKRDRDEHRNRLEAAEKAIAAALGTSEKLPLSLTIGELEVIAAALTERLPEVVLAKAAERLRVHRDWLRGRWALGESLGDTGKHNRLLGLEEAASRIDPAYGGVAWINQPADDGQGGNDPAR